MSCGFILRAAHSFAAAAAFAHGANAGIVAEFDVGFGSSTSTVQIDFTNGNGYLLRYHYEHSPSGLDALHAFEAAIPEFTLVTKDFGFGELVTGLGVLRDFEYGTGDQWPAVENYWHYWLQDSGSWQWAPMGASDRTLFDGSIDGWVFGVPSPPQPVPLPAAAIALAGVSMLCHRRR